MNKQPRNHREQHLAFIRQLSCLVCGDDVSVEAAHVRYSDLKAGKRSTGMAEKSDDSWAVPLCGKCHRKQHKVSERGFWEFYNIDPVKVSLALWKFTGDHAMGQSIVASNRAD